MGLTAKNPFENDDQAKGQEARAGSGSNAVTVTGIDHIAIAVADLDIALDHYRESFGLTVETRELLEEDGIEVAVLRVGATALQLVAPTRNDADLADFLTEWGPGLHHLGLAVTDAAGAANSLEAQGHELVDDEPRAGVDGAQVSFVNPHDVDGTIIQLVEHP